MPPRRKASNLSTKTWTVSGIGRLRLVEPTLAQLDAVDAAWPAARRPTDWHGAWRWRELTAGKVEVFAVVGADDRMLGLWCSAKRSPIKTPDGPFYRLDFLEVSPGARGQEAGVFLLALIAARALELGAQGIVLGTWEVLRGFYEGLGAVERRPRGWNVEDNLIPFVFDSERLADLKAALDGMEDDDQGTTDL